MGDRTFVQVGRVWCVAGSPDVGVIETFASFDAAAEYIMSRAEYDSMTGRWETDDGVELVIGNDAKSTPLEDKRHDR